VCRFFIYIMTNHERTAYYVGMTNDLVRRVIEHQHGIGSSFTKKYKTVCLVYHETYKYVNDAIDREKEIKKWRREKKVNLIKTQNGSLADLSVEYFLEEGIAINDVQEIVKELRAQYSHVL
jgi:putative endonuclease